VRLDETVKDKWASRTPHRMRHSDNEIKMMKDAVDTAQEMMHKPAPRYDVNYTPSSPGTCVTSWVRRAWERPKTSVLNPWNRCGMCRLIRHRWRCVPVERCVNPTLTMMAMTVRACEHILDRAKRREI